MLPAFREYERCSTTVIDAYLSPLLGRYLGSLTEACRERGLAEPEVMRSSGGTADAAEAARSGAWSVLSGPAGGAVGAGAARPRAPASPTRSASTWAAPPATSASSTPARCGAPTRARSRGARSSCRWSTCTPSAPAAARSAGATPAGRSASGPRSAGAEPGPACYGRGGTEPTVTDANLLLGYLSPDSDLAGGVALDVDAAAAARSARWGTQLGLGEIETAEGIVRVANQEMIRALRVMTVERGVDPRGYALLPFGGAGPMHAAALADELEITRLVCPRASGVLSALGLIAAGHRRDTARTVLLSGR